MVWRGIWYSSASHVIWLRTAPHKAVVQHWHSHLHQLWQSWWVMATANYCYNCQNQNKPHHLLFIMVIGFCCNKMAITCIILYKIWNKHWNCWCNNEKYFYLWENAVRNNSLVLMRFIPSPEGTILVYLSLCTTFSLEFVICTLAHIKCNKWNVIIGWQEWL